jgi:hypothetical protein
MRRFWYFLKLTSWVTLALMLYMAVILAVLLGTADMSVPVGTALMTSGIAIVTSIIALFKDSILEGLNRPRLAIRFFPYDNRDCHATTFRAPNTGLLVSKVHYFRLRVENIGFRAAEEVEVNLEEVNRLRGKKFVLDTDFMPLRFVWSHWRERPARTIYSAGDLQTLRSRLYPKTGHPNRHH